MNNPNVDKTITEGELCELLNVSAKTLGVWETPTPNEIIHDGFHIRFINEMVTDYIQNVAREHFRLTNTHMVFSTGLFTMINRYDSILTSLNNPDTVLAQQQTSSAVRDYIISNTKRTLMQIGFVKSFYRMIDEISIYMSGGSINKKFCEIRSVIKHSVTANFPTMLSNILETDWEKISMMYFVHTHQNIPASDLNWELFEREYEFRNVNINLIMENVIDDFFKRNDRRDESEFIEIKALLLKWKHDHLDDFEGESEDFEL